jgi:hypothetical protein
VDPRSIEALRRFAEESSPKVIEGLKKLHRGRYPEDEMIRLAKGAPRVAESGDSV